MDVVRGSSSSVGRVRARARALSRPAWLGWLEVELEAGRYALPAVLVSMACAAVYLLVVTDREGFYLDEWNFIYQRLDFTPDGLLQPYVDNLIALPLLLYQATIAVFGLGAAHLPIRLLWIAAILACSLLLFVYLRARTLPWFAFFPACLLLVFGAAWTDQATSIGLVRLSSIAAGLGALVALDRKSRGADLWAAALLTGALASHSAALPFVLGAAVTIALRGGPDARRRAWIWAIPLSIYLAWAIWARLAYGGAPIDPGNVLKVPEALLDGVSAVIAGACGRYLTNDGGRIYALDHGSTIPLALLLALWMTFLAVRRRFPREAFVGLSMTLFYWLIVGLMISPARQPTADRYLYMGAVLLAITVAPLLPRRLPPPLAWVGIAAAFVAFSIAPNVRALSQSAENVEKATDETRAALTAVEIARDDVSTEFDPTSAVPEFGGGLYLPASADPYLAAVDRYGSPALSEAALLERDEDARRVADAVLISALGLRLRTAAEQSAWGNPTACRPRRAETGDPIILPQAGRITIRPERSAGAEVSLARYASSPTAGLGRVAGGEVATLSIPRDHGTRPWRLKVIGRSTVEACGGRSASP